MYELERSDPLKIPPMAFRIEDCLVLPTLNRIERDGETIQLEPRVMRVLLQLASRPGSVFSRQELFDTVWADSVVCEEALTRTISELRRVFRDDTKTPRVIETIRKGGYRLVAAVIPAAAEEEPRVLDLERGGEERPAPALVPMEPIVATAHPARGNVARALTLVAAISLAIGIAFVMVRAGRSTHPLEAVPLTSTRGLELFPALSPNGAMLVYCWSGEEGGDASALDLYTMKVPDGSPVRLTSLPGSESWPAWSPDGSEIAFAAESDGGSALATISISGGAPRTRMRLAGPVTGLDWSPDGRSLVYSGGEASATPRIHLLHLDDLSDRFVTQPLEGAEGDVAPTLSPDGRAIAFLRMDARGMRSAWVAPSDGGAARSLDLGGRRVSGLDWLSRRELVVAAASNVDFGLWKVALESGKKTPLLLAGGRLQRLSLARSGGRLAYEKLSFSQSIWRVDRQPEGSRQRSLEPILASTQRDAEPTPSPDGSLLAFVSDRSGYRELWVSGPSGEAPRKLTDHRAALLVRPRWSPDGREIVYSRAIDGRLRLFTIEVASAISRPVGREVEGAAALWSRHDGNVYYERDGSNGLEVWRTRRDGSGATRAGEVGRHLLGEATDGLVALRTSDSAIVLLPFDGGAESVLVASAISGDWQEIALAERGLYFTTKSREASTLGYYDLAAQRRDSLATLPYYAASLALSSDRATLFFDAIRDLEIDLALTELY